MGRIMRGLMGLGTHALARRLKSTFSGDPLATRKLSPCQCGRWEKFMDERIAHCGGKGVTRYRISVRKTSTDKRGKHLPRPVYEADVATMKAPSSDNWTPHLWKVERARLLQFLTEKAAIRGSKGYVQKACKKS